MAGRKVPLEVASLGVLTFISTLLVSTYGGCEFKSEWVGKWFINGVATPLTINITHMDSKGRCIETRADMFMLEDPSETCIRCLIIQEKHLNVLQFKESYCDAQGTFESLCFQIPGDAALVSLIRTEPLYGAIPCPFKNPPFVFSYDRGTGECSTPVSRVEACTDESKLSIKYQACPDVQGTESTVNEITCVAGWRDGSTSFLLAKVARPGDEKASQDSYHCFSYEITLKNTYVISQSPDASCNGVISPKEGSHTMKMAKLENAHTKCKYPSWITEHHHWHTLDYKKSYHFSHKNATLKITVDGNADGNSRALSITGLVGKKSNEMRIVCHSEVKTSSHHSIVTAHVTSGCNSGYICLAFYRRDSTVMELQQSTKLVESADDACNSINFIPSSLPYITLITASLRQRKCPHPGRYSIIGQSDEDEFLGRVKREEEVLEDPVGLVEIEKTAFRDPRLWRIRREESIEIDKEKEEVKKECIAEGFVGLNIGCTGVSDTMQFETNCGADLNAEYNCYGSWEENGTYYLIASPTSRKSTEARRYCFISSPVYDNEDENGEIINDQIRKNSGYKLMLSTVAETCSRDIQPGFTGIKTFNFSLTGPCAESKSSDNGSSFTITTVLFLMSLLTLLFGTR